MPFILLSLFGDLFAGGGGGGGSKRALQFGKPTGPLFDKDIRGIVRSELRDLVGELLAEGERTAKLNLYPGHGVITGHYRRSIHGDMTGSMNGIVHDSKVIYGPWLEWGSNTGGRFKGYHSFRLARQKMESIAEKKAGKAGKKIVGRLGG